MSCRRVAQARHQARQALEAFLPAAGGKQAQTLAAPMLWQRPCTAVRSFCRNFPSSAPKMSTAAKGANARCCSALPSDWLKAWHATHCSGRKHGCPHSASQQQAERCARGCRHATEVFLEPMLACRSGGAARCCSSSSAPCWFTHASRLAAQLQATFRRQAASAT